MFTAPIAGAPFGVPVVLIGFGGIVAHPRFPLTFQPIEASGEATPGFVPFTPASIAPLTGVPTSFWEGRWKAQSSDGKSVSAEFTKVGNHLKASVDERIMAPHKFTADNLATGISIADDLNGDRWEPRNYSELVAMQAREPAWQPADNKLAADERSLIIREVRIFSGLTDYS